MLRDGLFSLMSLLLGLALALVVGSFMGWSTNPDRTAAFDAANMELARSGFSGTHEEIDKRRYELAQKYPGFNSPEPNTLIAILKWHPLLLGAFSLVLLSLFRPSIVWTTAVFVPTAVMSYLIINLNAALALLAAMVVSLIWSAAYARFRKKIAP